MFVSYTTDRAKTSWLVLESKHFFEHFHEHLSVHLLCKKLNTESFCNSSVHWCCQMSLFAWRLFQPRRICSTICTDSKGNLEICQCFIHCWGTDNPVVEHTANQPIKPKKTPKNKCIHVHLKEWGKASSSAYQICKIPSIPSDQFCLRPQTVNLIVLCSLTSLWSLNRQWQ